MRLKPVLTEEKSLVNTTFKFKKNPEERSSRLELSEILTVLSAFKRGDLTVRAPEDRIGLAGQVADTLNEIIEISNWKSEEKTRVISERNKIEETEKLRDWISMQRKVIASVSHELLTPIAAIKASVETLCHRVADDQDRSQFIKIIDNHSIRLGYLVEDLLAVVELESKKHRLEPISVALHAFVLDFIKNIRPRAERKELSIQVDIKKNLEIWVDQSHLNRIFHDLLDNAIKYNKKGGVIRLEGKKINKRQAQISIYDTGSGILKKDLELIFQQFYKTQKTRRLAIPDTGLGLYIIKTIVESNGGRIWAESARGQGSVFHVILPLLPMTVPLKN